MFTFGHLTVGIDQLDSRAGLFRSIQKSACLDPARARANAVGVAREFVSNFVLHSWEPTDVWSGSKNVGSAYTKLLILLEFSPILGLPIPSKRAKIRATFDRDVSPVFFSSKSAKLKVGISSIRTRLRGGLYWKGY
jgi:hypothetical protein